MIYDLFEGLKRAQKIWYSTYPKYFIFFVIRLKQHTSSITSHKSFHNFFPTKDIYYMYNV